MPGDSVSFCFTIFFPRHIFLGHGVRYLRAPSCHTPSVSHPYECDEASLLLAVALRPHPVFHLDSKHFRCCVCHTVVARHCCGCQPMASGPAGTSSGPAHGLSKVPPSGRVSLLKRATSRLCRFKTAWLVFTVWERRKRFNPRTPTLPHCGELPAVTAPELASPSRSLF